MSLWGYFKLAPHVYLLFSNYITLEECQDILFPLASIHYHDLPAEQATDACLRSLQAEAMVGLRSKQASVANCNRSLAKASTLREEDEGNLITSLISNINYTDQDLQVKAVGAVAFSSCLLPVLSETVGGNGPAMVGTEINKIRANLRIGPHNKDILSILFGSLLGDAHGEFRLKGNGTRISFYQEGSHVSYLIWLHKLISELGYCNTKLPKITTRLGKKGVVRKIIRFNT
jgi:LAGLIDADG DNA endonuclease family